MILDPDYARVFTQARIIAWQYGYACLMHGSYTRDLDLLLVPWEDRARPNHDQLLKLIADACGLRFRDGEENIFKAKPDFTEKPHGRRSCSLFFPAPSDRRWVDISIAPCTPKGSAEGHTEYESWNLAFRVRACGCGQPAGSCSSCSGSRFTIGAATGDGAERRVESVIEKLRRCKLGCGPFGQCKAAMHGVPSECAAGVKVGELGGSNPPNLEANPPSSAACVALPAPWIDGNGVARPGVLPDEPSGMEAVDGGKR